MNVADFVVFTKTLFRHWMTMLRGLVLDESVVYDVETAAL